MIKTYYPLATKCTRPSEYNMYSANRRIFYRKYKYNWNSIIWCPFWEGNKIYMLPSLVDVCNFVWNKIVIGNGPSYHQLEPTNSEKGKTAVQRFARSNRLWMSQKTESGWADRQTLRQGCQPLKSLGQISMSKIYKSQCRFRWPTSINATVTTKTKYLLWTSLVLHLMIATGKLRW